MPYVSTGLRNTMVANAWVRRDSRTSNQERERAIRTRATKRMIKRMMRRRRIR